MEYGIIASQDTLLWFILRLDAGVVSASDVPAVFFASPFKSRMRLFREKYEYIVDPEGCLMSKLNCWLEDGNKSYGAAKIGKESEHIVQQKYMKLFKPGERVFKICGHLKTNDIPISCSPDFMEYTPDGKFVTGIEIKTMVARDVPPIPKFIYQEHWLQCLASSIVLKGDQAKEYKWRLIYYNYQTDKIKIFDIRCNWEVAATILDKVSAFIIALKTKNFDYGRTRKNNAQFYIDLERLYDLGVEAIEIDITSPTDTFRT